LRRKQNNKRKEIKMKFKIVLFVFVMMVMASYCFAYTAETKASVTKVFTKGGVKHYEVCIDGELLETTICRADRDVRVWDTVLLSITIERKRVQKVKIVYRFPYDGPPAYSGPPNDDSNPPGWNGTGWD
jgi:hypothetical protein